MDVATEVSAAAERIRDHVRETPVEESRPLGEAGEYFFSVNRYLFMVVKPGRPSEG